MGKYSDISITCNQCGKKFVFSEEEQEFYKSKGYTPPLHCKQCRSARQVKASECTACGNKLVESAPQYCAACYINVQLEFEQKALALKNQLRETESKLQLLEAEKSKIQAEASLGLRLPQDEKNRVSEETSLNIAALEKEKASLAEALRQKETTIACLEQRLEQASCEIPVACKEPGLHSWAQLLSSLREKVEILERNQNSLQELLLKFMEMNSHNQRGPHFPETIKSLFRSGRRSPV